MKYITFENLNSFATKLADKITEKFAKKTDIPTSLPANGGNAATVNGHTVASNVPANAVFTDTVFVHPTTSGNKHIPSGGSAGQFLKWSADGTAVWAADNNTTYSNMTAATASAAGKAGLVPAPAAGAQAKYLRGDGTWAEIPATEAATEADIDDIIAGVFS